MYFNFLHIVLKILIFYYSVNNLHVCSLAYNTKNEKKISFTVYHMLIGYCSKWGKKMKNSQEMRPLVLNTIIGLTQNFNFI